jgi:hypothetical protein
MTSDSERGADQTLKDLGFRIPNRVTARHLFDIVVPAVLLIAAIVTAFWVANDAICREMSATDRHPVYKSIVAALTSAMAASLMYGAIIAIVLKHRAAQKVWREWSWRLSDPNHPQSRAGDMARDRLFHRALEPSDAWQSLIAIAQPPRRYQCERFDRARLVLFRAPAAGWEPSTTARSMRSG